MKDRNEKMMTEKHELTDIEKVTQLLYQKLSEINAGILELEPYEFRYCMHPWHPQDGWQRIELISKGEIENMINDLAFYEKIQMKPRQGDSIVLDESIIRLNRMLFAGLVTGDYSPDWVKRFFYFDIRGFYFLPRTVYFTEQVLEHFNHEPYRQFEQKQREFVYRQDIGYKQFKQANAEVDQLFIDIAKKLARLKGTPVVLAIAGPTAAGKTEIVERLHVSFRKDGLQTTSMEMDNFLTDRDEREARGVHSLGSAAIHLDLFVKSLTDICQGKQISIPRYDFIEAISSHDLQGSLKPGCSPIMIQPADIIFIEGNFPFLIPEVAHLIGIKAVYLTSDEVRMKRKWKRDIDYRKKYEPTYFRNRYFQSQYPMAQKCYIPQLEVCDLAVDTTEAALWITPCFRQLLDTK